MKPAALLLGVLITTIIAYSQPGALDPSFGNKGIVRTDFGASANINGVRGTQVLTQTDGTLYLIFEANGQTVVTRNLANGTLDASYGNKGHSESVNIRDAKGVLQSDGKTVVAGTTFDPNTGTDFSLARYNTDGTLDTTFSQDGKITTDFASNSDFANSVAIQSDGKIVAAGTTIDPSKGFDFALARYNTDGTLDTTFSKDGKATTDFGSNFDIANSVAIQSDGKIVAAGSASDPNTGSDFALACYNSDGTLDTTFSKGGKITTDFAYSADLANSVAIQSDGKIVAAGSMGDFAIARYNTDGTLDTTFSNDGKITTDFAYSADFANSVAIESDGKIVAAGGTGTDFALARYNTDGTLDISFSKDGKITTDFASIYEFANSVAIQTDGKIVVAGTTYDPNKGSDFALARYNADGSLDKTFSQDGKLTDYLHVGSTYYNSVGVQGDGKVVAAGVTYTGKGSDFALARYNADGSLDTTFSADGKQTTNFGTDGDAYSVATQIAIQRDGKIIVVGTSSNLASADFALVRYNTDGTLDSTFSKDGKETTDFGSGAKATSIVLQSDGKIIVAGTIADPATSYFRFGFARYNIDGTLDSTFSQDGKQLTDLSSGPENAGYSLAIQSDGKLVAAVSGDYSPFVGIARYNSDGTLDTTFSKDGKETTNFVSSVAIQSDGKIVVAGYEIARYNTDGTLDSSFAKAGKHVTDFSVSSLGIQTDGKIVVAGSGNIYNGNQDNLNFKIARFNPNGSLDSSFGIAGEQATDVNDGNKGINDIAIFGNKLYAVGYSQNPGYVGVVARYFLDSTENKPPIVNLSIPHNIVKYAAPARIKLNATATDEDGRITKVRFYNGATHIHSETKYPYGFLYINVPAGEYTFSAKAYDDSGNVATSNAIHVLVVEENVPPIVSIESPAHDTTYNSPDTIILVASAHDPNERITKVEFYEGSTLLRTEYIYPYTCIWTSPTPGIYTITAKAYDAKGLATASVPITITINSAIIVSSRPLIEGSKGAINLKITPNPAHIILKVFTKGLQQGKPATITVISATGVVMKTIQTNVSNQIVRVDVSSLVSGVYIVKVMSGDKVLQKQFVKL